MKYKGMEVTEANGVDYQLGSTPKKMLVWDSPNDQPVVVDVLGCYDGDWVAASVIHRGIIRWEHAAEIPPAKVRPFISAKELDWAIAEHGPYVLKVATGTRMIITSYDDSAVCCGGSAQTMEYMLDRFTFLDGAPCGV